MRDDQKRQQLLDTALEVFVEKGFRGAATSEISQRAGAATGSLFYHFKSKEKLFETLYRTLRQQLIDNLYQEVGQVDGFQPKLERLWFCAVHWCLDHKQHYYFLKSVEVTPAFDTWIDDRVESNAEVFRQLLQASVVSPVSAMQWQLWCQLFVGMHDGFVRFLLNHPQLIAQDDWWHDSFKLCWQAMQQGLPDTAT